MLAYPDFVSLFVRLPIAHAAVTGRGVKVAVIYRTDLDSVCDAIQLAAPDAPVSTHTVSADPESAADLCDKIDATGCRIAVIPDAHRGLFSVALFEGC